MAWDDVKATGDEISADEWNKHVEDQKSRLLEQAEPVTGVKIVERFDGGTAEERLTNALSAADNGDKLILENGNIYNDSRTISKNVELEGTDKSSTASDGVFLSSAVWTLSGEVTVNGVGIVGSDGGGIVADSQYCSMEDILFFSTGATDITVSADNVILTEIKGPGTVTFESGTTGGEIGITTGDVSITDNGTNSVL